MPVSVHRRAVGRSGLGSSATQLMRAVRPPPPGEVSKPSWWVVVRRLPGWLAKAISGRNAASRFCYRSLAAQPKGKAAESRSAAYVCLGDGALGRRLAACILAKSVDSAAAGLAFWRRLGRVRLGGRLGHKSRWFWLVERGEAMPNERMQLTWLTGALSQAGLARQRVCGRRRPLIRHAADASRWAAPSMACLETGRNKVGKFDYINDPEFRASLESDYTEMMLCASSEAWKAVHVLAGSIVEAALIECIVIEEFRNREDALKMDLGQAISLCREKGVISQRSSDLSSVIRGYRNLVHPGRKIRLKEQVNRDSAEVAKSLVNLVVGEIEARRRTNYGYTAEQIVAKVRNDPTAAAIIGRLIRDTREAELRRLLLKVLPAELLALMGTPNSVYVADALGVCFRTALGDVGEDAKEEVVEESARIVRESNGDHITLYLCSFFRESDLCHASKDDSGLILQYILSRFERETTLWMKSMSGIGLFLDKRGVSSFADPVIKIIANNEEGMAPEAIELVEDEWAHMGEDIRQLFNRRLDAWAKYYREHSDDDAVQALDKLRRSLDSFDLPF